MTFACEWALQLLVFANFSISPTSVLPRLTAVVPRVKVFVYDETTNDFSIEAAIFDEVKYFCFEIHNVYDLGFMHYDL